MNWDSSPTEPESRTETGPRPKSWSYSMKSIKIKVGGIWSKALWYPENTHSFMVTGSARLDHFRKGGDSLLGRYHYYRLHPYSLTELKYEKDALKKLMTFGGFPEPYHEADERNLRRWHNQRLDRLIKTDLRDWEDVKDLEKIYSLAEELPNRVGSPLSIAALAGDIEADFKTIKRWLGILSSLYYCYQIAPFGSTKIRAVKKSRSLSLDWARYWIREFVLRTWWVTPVEILPLPEDVEGQDGACFLRIQTNAKSIVVLKDKNDFCRECKTGESSRRLICDFRDRTSILHFYQVHMGTKSNGSMTGFQSCPLKSSVWTETLLTLLRPMRVKPSTAFTLRRQGKFNSKFDVADQSQH